MRHMMMALIALGAASLSVVGNVQAANTVDPAFTGTQVLSGDKNRVTGTPRETQADGPQMISGRGNTLVNTDSSQVYGGDNTLTNSDMVLMGQTNTVSNTYGNIFGDANTVDTGTSYGKANVVGNSSRVQGNNNNVLGSWSSVTGQNSDVIGNAASVNADNSMALGFGSTNTRNNTVSFGSSGKPRQLTNVAAGTAETDVSNVKQMQEADTATLGNANGYTDNRESAINRRTDDLMAQEQAERDDADRRTLNSANGYTDAREQAMNRRMDERLSDEASERVSGDITTLNSANNHTDTRVTTEQQARLAGDRQTLHDANIYTNQRETFIDQRTDGLMAEERQARVEGEHRMLDNANRYTNRRFEQLGNRVNRNARRANAGIAAAMAQSGIPYLNGSTLSSFGMAASSYRGETAIASGYQRQMTPFVTVRVSLAWDTRQGIGVTAGMAVGW